MNFNLPQVRAENALNALQPDGPAAECKKPEVSELPALVLSCGLLPTAAYADEMGEKGPKRAAAQRAMNAVAAHLADERVGRLPPGTTTARALIGHLCRVDAESLAAATDETLEYLAYLKRFAPPKAAANVSGAGAHEPPASPPPRPRV